MRWQTFQNSAGLGVIVLLRTWKGWWRRRRWWCPRPWWSWSPVLLLSFPHLTVVPSRSPFHSFALFILEKPLLTLLFPPCCCDFQTWQLQYVATLNWSIERLQSETAKWNVPKTWLNLWFDSSENPGETKEERCQVLVAQFFDFKLSEQCLFLLTCLLLQLHFCCDIFGSLGYELPHDSIVTIRVKFALCGGEEEQTRLTWKQAGVGFSWSVGWQSMGSDINQQTTWIWKEYVTTFWQPFKQNAEPLVASFEARDEMISAVNSLPVKGRKVHQRLVVAKLQKSSQVGWPYLKYSEVFEDPLQFFVCLHANQDASGTVNLKRCSDLDLYRLWSFWDSWCSLPRLPEVMKKLTGRDPQHVTCKDCIMGLSGWFFEWLADVHSVPRRAKIQNLQRCDPQGQTVQTWTWIKHHPVDRLSEKDIHFEGVLCTGKGQGVPG